MRKHIWLIILIIVFFFILVITAPSHAAQNSSVSLDFLNQIYPVVTQPTVTNTLPSIEITPTSTPPSTEITPTSTSILETPIVPTEPPVVSGSETPTQEVTSSEIIPPEATPTRAIIGEGYSLVKSNRYEKNNYWLIGLGLIATLALLGIGIFVFSKRK